MYHSRKRYLEKCWICGNTADSDEHKFKRSDIVKAYGKGQYVEKGEFQPMLINIRNSYISGSNDKKITIRNVLCQKCNNHLSQPFDTSYEKFSNYISNHIDLIQESNKIDFQDIYGGEWPDQIINLYKYFIKIFGCRLSKEGIKISKNVIEFLTSKNDKLKHMKFRFAIKPDIVNLQNFGERGYHHLYFGGLEWVGVSEKETETIFSWFTNYGISIYWVYNLSIESGNKYQPFLFQKEELVEVQQSEHLPKEKTTINGLVDFIEGESYNKIDLINSILFD
ncbi:hypothetical protein SAMN05661096_03602 [Marivirga sericea]|uniref:Uncharacterized protein n=1 Tax=Marivirga sericea TaxID=1028 RepID=A0A1X7L652_9BACT|nr:hypothetical protein [Marivirga sericea]SMG49316.1 hypothetical protein SAMN05661096_03602 [Marivirga sericea]